MNMDDIFSMFGDIFGGHGFGGFGGGQRHQQQHRGSDLRLKVRLTLEEINSGVTKKFKVRKDIPCEHCNGSGAEAGSGRNRTAFRMNGMPLRKRPGPDLPAREQTA